MDFRVPEPPEGRPVRLGPAGIRRRQAPRTADRHLPDVRRSPQQPRQRQFHREECHSHHDSYVLRSPCKRRYISCCILVPPRRLRFMLFVCMAALHNNLASILFCLVTWCSMFAGCTHNGFGGSCAVTSCFMLELSSLSHDPISTCASSYGILST
jgi:hypothetical protein